MNLYVMQNEFGFVKVGRSARVEQRRRALEKTDMCRIQVVLVVPGAGDREEEVHIACDDHRILGEWFDGTPEAREDVLQAVGWRLPVVWPFDLCGDDEAEAWFDLLDEKRAIRSMNREFGRVALNLDRDPIDPATDPMRYADITIWSAIWRFEHRCDTMVFTEKDADGKEILVGRRRGDPNGDVLPFYTRDMEAALALWPEALRPESWTGSAAECCAAALRARKRKVD